MKQLLATHLTYKKYILSRLKDFGLKAGQPKIMYYIASNEGCQQKDIAQNCYIESATLSSVLLKMEKRGLIERKRLNSDKRAYAIYIKDKARPVFEAVQRVFDEVLKLSLEGFSDEEAAEFEKYLERMENNLKNT